MAEQISATIIQIDSRPMIDGGLTIGFPTKAITIEELVDSGDANSLINFNGTNFYATETQADLVTAANAGGGGGGVETVTYAEMVALIGGGGLTVGSQYLITDYATKHFIVDAGGAQYLDSIITGVNEPLIVTANSVNTIDKNAKSALHPEDIIYYDWNPDNWVDDLSFADLSGTPTMVTGFKGVVYFRHDTLLDNYMGYDFRNCKFRRWKTNITAWDSGTSYNIGNFSSSGGFIYASVIDNNLNNIPSSNSNNWARLINLSLTEYWCNNPASTNGITAGSEFNDFKTFSEGSGTATYELCCRANHFDGFKDDSEFEISGTLLPNNVFFLQDNQFFQFFSNRVASEFCMNTCAGYFFSLSIGTHCLNNIFGGDGFTRNTILSYCGNNILGQDFKENILEDTFNNNLIGDSFAANICAGDFENNIISANCNSNCFGYNTTSNRIGIGCVLNNIASSFVLNKIVGGFKKVTTQPNIESQNMTSWNIVYGDYPKELIGGVTSGEYWVRYIDADGAQQIATAST